MKKILTPILIWYSIAAFGQQLPQYSMFMLNPYAYNPAYAGLENSLVVTGVFRQQWVDLNGGPATQQVNAHLPVYFLSSGVGLRMENDKIGAHRTASVALTYDYQKEIGRNSLLSLGVSGVFFQYALDGSKLRTPDGNYEDTQGGSIQHNDPNLPEGVVQANNWAIEAGAYFQSKFWEAGVAMQPIISPELKISNSGSLLLSLRSVYLASLSRKVNLGENIMVRPAVLFKSDLVASQTEIALNFFWRDNMMTGASFRGFGRTSKDAVAIFAGMKLNEKTTLAYSFDLPLSQLRQAHRGSHEILLKYNLNKSIGEGKLPPVIYNPRFF